MSGSKDTVVAVADTGAELAGSAVLGLLAVATAAAAVTGVLAFYGGKVAIKGTRLAGEALVATGQAAADGVRKYQEYQQEQQAIRERMMAERLFRQRKETSESAQQVERQIASFVREVAFRDEGLDEFAQEVGAILQKAPEMTLEQLVRATQELRKKQKRLENLKTLKKQLDTQRAEIRTQIQQTEDFIRSNAGEKSAEFLRQLETLRARLNDATLQNFSTVCRQWSAWQIQISGQIRSEAAYSRGTLLLDALWNSLPVSREVAKTWESTTVAQLERMDHFIRNQRAAHQIPALERELAEFQKLFEPFLVKIQESLQIQNERQAQNEKIRAEFLPQIEELEQMLTLASTEIVKRWSASDLEYLHSALEKMSQQVDNGNFETIQNDIESWKYQFETMLTSAGIKQREFERRNYIVRSLRSVLPEMGFTIRSVQNEPAVSGPNESETILRLVPQSRSGSGKESITITIPHSESAPVNYRFDGYPIKKTREQGQPIVENDDGKRIVQEVTTKLRPFGIVAGAPTWQGNPDRIRKGAKDLPNSEGPVTEETWSAEAHETKHRYL
ncbi:MAG: hypothetical protein Q4D38_06265 [Planctomycetia bacterium]|nr:hypothetical protein [Planctomycetia bacterium]